MCATAAGWFAACGSVAGSAMCRADEHGPVSGRVDIPSARHPAREPSQVKSMGRFAVHAAFAMCRLERWSAVVHHRPRVERNRIDQPANDGSRHRRGVEQAENRPSGCPHVIGRHPRVVRRRCSPCPGGGRAQPSRPLGYQLRAEFDLRSSRAISRLSACWAKRRPAAARPSAALSPRRRRSATVADRCPAQPTFH